MHMRQLFYKQFFLNNIRKGITFLSYLLLIKKSFKNKVKNFLLLIYRSVFVGKFFLLIDNNLQMFY